VGWVQVAQSIHQDLWYSRISVKCDGISANDQVSDVMSVSQFDKLFEILAQHYISMNYILFEFALRLPTALHMILIAKIENHSVVH
jgi:hypothetical protein